MKNVRVIMNCQIKLDASPHFKLEGRLIYDSDDTEQVQLLETEQHVEMKYRFYALHNGEINDRSFWVTAEETPRETMERGIFTALKYYLKMYYEDMEQYGKKDPVSERLLVDTVGFCNYHTFQKIAGSCWMYDHTEEQIEIQIIEEEGITYSIKNGEIYGDSGGWLGKFKFQCVKSGETEQGRVLYYDDSHFVNADIASFADVIAAMRKIPEFFRKYNTEAWQIKEAVKRLRFLGVSEKEIKDFEERRLIPKVEIEPDGSVKRGCYDDLKIGMYDHWRSVLGWEFRALRGGMPYLQFCNKGVISMKAWLYVEPLIDEREAYRSEMVKGSSRQIMTAVVFRQDPVALNWWAEYEYGSIMIELTEDGPVRTG